MSERIRLGELLVRAGLLTEAQLEAVLAAQRASGRKFGQEVVAQGFVDETQVTQMLSNQLSVPWVSLYKVPFTRELLSLVPAEIADRHNLIPVYVRKVRRQGDTLFVALDDPQDDEALSLVSRVTGLPVKPMVSPPSEIRNAIRVYYFGLPPVTQPTSSGELAAITADRLSSPEIPASSASAAAEPERTSQPEPAAPPAEEEASEPVPAPGGPMSTNTLTKAEIVDNIYEKSERNRAEVKAQVETMLDIMKDAIKKDHSLLISGFGKFEAYDKDARKGRNPQTSESIILAERKVVVFRISRKLRAELNPQ